MAATITTLDSVLKEFYAKAIAEQLNQEVLMLELFEKAKLDWSGKRVVVPVHIARNTGVGFTGEGAALPTAGEQTYDELHINAKFLYGRFQLTGPAIASAKGAYSFGNYIDLELRKLVQDVKKTANVACFSGGRVVGWSQCRMIRPAGAGAVPITNSAGGVNVNIPFSGDATEFERKRAAAVAAGGTLTISLRDMATYDRPTGMVAAADNIITVTGVNTITNTFTGTTVGAAFGVTYADNDGCSSLEIVGNAAALATANLEITGIASNLGSAVHHGVDRTDATGGTGAELQVGLGSIRSTDNTALPANHDTFSALDLGQMQAVADSIYTSSGKEADWIIMNPAQRASYTNLLVGVNAANLFKSTDSAKKGDGGFTGLGFNGTPIKVSVDAGQHCYYFLNSKSWRLAQLEKPGFADLDGNILARAGVGAGGIDAYEGYYRMYCDIYAERPNANGVVTSIA